MSILSELKKLLIKWDKSDIIIHYVKIFKYILLKREYPYKWGEIIVKNSGIKSKEKKIVYICDGFKNHGGLTDRFKGLLTTYSEAKKLKTPFYIYWTSPFQLTDFLIPTSSIDWRIEKKDILYNYKDSFPFIMDISPVHYKNIIKKYLFRHCLLDKRDILVYTNLMHEKKNHSDLFNELFKPSHYLRENIDFYLKSIGAPYYSYTFRFGNLLGDFKDIVGTTLVDKNKFKLIEKNLKELKVLIKDLPDSYKVLVTSDSFYFLEKVKEIDNRICIVKKKLMHVDYYDIEKTSKETWLKSFLDFFLIMNAEKVYQLKTDEMYNSSFPYFAAQIGKKPYYLHKY